MIEVGVPLGTFFISIDQIVVSRIESRIRVRFDIQERRRRIAQAFLEIAQSMEITDWARQAIVPVVSCMCAQDFSYSRRLQIFRDRFRVPIVSQSGSLGSSFVGIARSQNDLKAFERIKKACPSANASWATFEVKSAPSFFTKIRSAIESEVGYRLSSETDSKTRQIRSFTHELARHAIWLSGSEQIKTQRLVCRIMRSTLRRGEILSQALAKLSAPKVVFIRNPVEPYGFASAQWAGANGVKCIWLQHGLLYEKDALWPLMEADEYWVWGNHWKNVVEAWGKASARVFVTGALYGDSIGGTKNTHINGNLENEGHDLLVALSGPGHSISQKTYIAILTFLKRAFERNPSRKFRVRLHPKELASSYSEFLSLPNVSIDFSGKRTLEQDIDASKAVLIVSSTLGLEALSRLKPLIRIDIPEARGFFPLENSSEEWIQHITMNATEFDHALTHMSTLNLDVSTMRESIERALCDLRGIPQAEVIRERLQSPNCMKTTDIAYKGA